MTIGLFGGAFNPPHIGHKQVADYLIAESIVDEVWFVPVYKHPWAARYGKFEMTDYEVRVAMLEQMCGQSQRVAHFRDVSYTYDTLTYFSEKHPEHEFKWVMGSEYLPKWDDFLSTHPKLSDFEILVYPRAGAGFEDLRANMTSLPNAPEVQASSTQIRESIKTARPYLHLLHPDVAAHIETSNVYG